VEKAEIYRISSVATYLMAARYPKYATQPEEVMAETLCRALIDHARIASAVNRIVIAEGGTTSTNKDRVRIAADALLRSFAMRPKRVCEKGTDAAETGVWNDESTPVTSPTPNGPSSGR
jgi:hypothetical protein